MSEREGEPPKKDVVNPQTSNDEGEINLDELDAKKAERLGARDALLYKLDKRRREKARPSGNNTQRPRRNIS